jgi:hypothetical protein
MANEFIARKGLIVSGSTTLTGSLTVAEGITGSLFGTSSWAENAVTSSFLLGGIESASFATTAATASFLLGGIESASFATTALTASFLLGGIESASFATTALTASFLLGGVESASFATSASRAETASLALSVSFDNVTDKPALVSASSQISYTEVSNIPSGIVSSSTQVISLLPSGTVSGSAQVSYTEISNVPADILSSSTQINNLSGVSASFATSASRAQTASFATTAATASSLSGSLQVVGLAEFGEGLIVSGGLAVNGGITGSLLGTSSWAVSSSVALDVDYANVSNKPTLVSASSQVSYTGLSDIPSGILSSSTQINNLSDVSASYAASASVATSAAIAQTAFLALNVDYANINNKPTLISASSQVSYTGLSDIPTGILSSSTQINNLVGVSASFATTASYANNANLLDGLNSTVFATTGSNNFVGNQQVSGNLSVVDNGTVTFNGLIFPATDGTFSGEHLVTDAAGNLAFELPEDIFTVVKNTSGGTLAKGTPVHVTGTAAAGFAAEVIAADAGIPSTMPATFIVNETLLDEEEGLAIILGKIRGVDTTGFTAGDPVYVGVGGGYTNVRPTGSALVQPLGLVTRIDATNGGGVILNPGVSNDLPNLTSGSVWVGNNNSVPVTVTTSSLIPVGTVSSSIQVSYTGLSDIPTGILSSSTQINNLSGVSASFATSASRAQTASLALAVDYTNVSNKPALVSASSQIDVRNTTGITTIATTGSNTFTGIQTISNTTNATDWNTGALIVDGGVGIEKDVWISGSLNVIGLLTAISTSIQYITASQVDIGNNIINLNTDTPALRYGGISVVDSGSVGVSASLLYDSLTNNWVFKHKDAGEPTEDFSNVLFGPLGTGPDNIPILTGNYIVKVENDGHGHHLTTSSIVDNGTTVTVETSLSVDNAISASDARITNDVYIGGDIQIAGTLLSGEQSILLISSSVINIENNRIVTNLIFPQRFGGISVNDSASVGQSGSLYWDSLKNRWIYETEESVPYTSAIIIAGPTHTGELGDEPELVIGRIPVATSDHNIDNRITSSSIRVDFPSRLTHIEAGLNVTGSITASVGFSGDGANITGIVSSSYATTASFATSASRAQTASLALAVDYVNVSNKPTLVSASSQVSYTGLSNIPAGILSSSTQINALSGVSASFATSASRAQTASLALAVDYANVSNKPTLISASSQVSYTSLSDIPADILSSSTQINNLSDVSASYALTASFALNGSSTPQPLTIDTYEFIGNGSETTFDITDIYDINSLFVSVDGLTFNPTDDYTISNTDIIFTVAPPSQSIVLVRGLVNTISGLVGSITGSLLGTSSFAITASYALNAVGGESASYAQTASLALAVDYANVNNKPTLVSASSQVSYTGLSDVPTGIFSASSQVSYTGLSNIPASIVSSSTQVTALLPTGTVSSSGQVSYTGLSNIPIGIVSASSQVSYTGLSNISAGILSSSTQINNLSGVSASFATSASFAPTILPAGTVSSSAQINTGSFSGSFVGDGSGLTNLPGGGGNSFPFTGSAAITGSLIITGSSYGNVSAITVASNTASFDIGSANFFTITMATSSVTHFNVTNPLPGQTVSILVRTNTASTASFSSNIRQVTGSLYTPSVSGSNDILTFVAFDSASVFMTSLKQLV